MRKQYATTRYSKHSYDVFKSIAQENNVSMIELMDKMAEFLATTHPQTHRRILQVPAGKGVYSKVA